MNTIKVLKKGIKVNGEYLRCVYYKGGLMDNYPKDTITIYARDFYPSLPKELSPVNHTDSNQDVFAKDIAHIEPNHFLYNDFLKHCSN